MILRAILVLAMMAAVQSFVISAPFPSSPPGHLSASHLQKVSPQILFPSLSPLFACRPNPKKAKALRNLLNARKYRVRASASLFTATDVALASRELSLASQDAANYALGGPSPAGPAAQQALDREAEEQAQLGGAATGFQKKTLSRRKLTKQIDSGKETMRQDRFVAMCFKSDAEWRALGEGGDGSDGDQQGIDGEGEDGNEEFGKSSSAGDKNKKAGKGGAGDKGAKKGTQQKENKQKPGAAKKPVAKKPAAKKK